MKKLILLSIMIVFAQAANCENFYNGLKKIEKQILNQSYEYELPEQRLERLETKMFGTCQSGTVNDRYNLVSAASKNYKMFNSDANYNTPRQVYNQYRPPIFTGSSGSNWRNTLWGNFMNQFAGYPTGLTPTLSQGMDPAYMDYFEAEREMMRQGYGGGYQNYYQTPRGYRNVRTDRSSRTGVHILD